MLHSVAQRGYITASVAGRQPFQGKDFGVLLTQGIPASRETLGYGRKPFGDKIPANKHDKENLELLNWVRVGKL